MRRRKLPLASASRDLAWTWAHTSKCGASTRAGPPAAASSAVIMSSVRTVGRRPSRAAVPASSSSSLSRGVIVRGGSDAVPNPSGRPSPVAGLVSCSRLTSPPSPQRAANWVMYRCHEGVPNGWAASLAKTVAAVPASVATESGSRTSASSRMPTAILPRPPAGRLPAGSALAGSAVVAGARSADLSTRARSSSVTSAMQRASPAWGNSAASLSASAEQRSGVLAASRTSATAGVSRSENSEAPSAGTQTRPSRTAARLFTITSTSAIALLSASILLIAASSHSGPGREAASCASPTRAAGAPPNRTGATPANSPNGTDRRACRMAYRATARLARRARRGSVTRPSRTAVTWPARSGLATVTARRKGSSAHTGASHDRQCSAVLAGLATVGGQAPAGSTMPAAPQCRRTGRELTASSSLPGLRSWEEMLLRLQSEPRRGLGSGAGAGAGAAARVVGRAQQRLLSRQGVLDEGDVKAERVVVGDGAAGRQLLSGRDAHDCVPSWGLGYGAAGSRSLRPGRPAFIAGPSPRDACPVRWHYPSAAAAPVPGHGTDAASMMHVSGSLAPARRVP